MGRESFARARGTRVALTVLTCLLYFAVTPSVSAVSPSITGHGNFMDGWNPSVSGDTVVCQASYLGFEGGGALGIGPNDIVGFRMPVGHPSLIKAAQGFQASPDVSGETVVWEHEGDVYGFDLETWTEFPICTAPGDQIHPRISGDLVVWADGRDATATGWDIYACDLSARREFPICARGASQVDPDVSGNRVVWTDSRNGNKDIWTAVVDRTTHSVTQSSVCTNSAWQSGPAVDGKWVVWIDHRSGDPAAYGYNLTKRGEFLIAESWDDGVDFYFPTEVDVSGRTVVWTENSPGTMTYLRGMNLATGQHFLIEEQRFDPLSGPRIDGSNVVAFTPRFFGGGPSVTLGWGMELAVVGEPEWVVDPSLRLEVAAATPDSWVTDMRFSSDGGASWSAWRDYATTSAYTLRAGEGHRSVSVQFRDHLGALSPTTSTPVGLDTQPPTSGHDADGQWRSTDTTVNLVASDATSGVARTEYRVDADATWHAGSAVTVAAAADHSADGTHTVRYRSVDVAGNVETAKSCAVRIDTTPPVTTQAGADGRWHNRAVAVTFTARDAGSGVDRTTSSLDGGAVWTEGDSLLVEAPADHSRDGLTTILFRSRDLLGFSEEARSCAVRIDTRRPSTDAPYAATVRRGRTATLRYQVSDAPPCAAKANVIIKVQTLGGRVVKVLKLGPRPVNQLLSCRFRCTLAKRTYRFHVFATDAAGNRRANVASNKLVVR